MKKFFLAIVAMVCTMSAFAQFPGGGQMPSAEEMATRQATTLKDSLQLNDETYKKVYDLYLNQTKEMQKMMQDMMNGGGQGAPSFDPQAMQERQKKQTEAFKAVLSEEQFKKYEEMQQNQRRRMMQQFGGGQGFGGGFGGPRQ